VGGYYVYNYNTKNHASSLSSEEVYAINSAVTDAAGEAELEDLTYPYCTEFIVLKEDKGADSLKLRAYLESIGDSAVVVDDEELIKCHVHTDQPGKALQKALEFGMLDKIKIRLASLGFLNGEGDTSQDAVLLLMLEDAQDAVKAYCHRKDIPKGLEHVVRGLVVRGVQADNADNVSAIKRGDTQINYATAVTSDSFTEKEIKALNSFRRLRVG